MPDPTPEQIEEAIKTGTVMGERPSLTLQGRIARALAERDARIAELEALQSDWIDEYKRVLDDDTHADEKHCTCVPMLRALNAAWRRDSQSHSDVVAAHQKTIEEREAELDRLEAQLSAVRAVRERLEKSDDMLDAQVVRWLDEALGVTETP